MSDAPLLFEIEALSLFESAAPAPFCSAAGSASALAGDAPLPLEIEALSLLEGATHGALRLVSDAVQTAVQAVAPSAGRAAAAEIELLEGATLGAVRLVSGAVQTAVQAAAPSAERAAAAEIEELSLLEGAVPAPFCSVPDPAGDMCDNFANALAAPAAIEVGAAAMLDDVTSGYAPMRTDASAGLCSQEGIVAGVTAASASFGASVSDAAPAPVCSAAGSAPGSLSCPAPMPFDAAPAPACSAAGPASGSLSCPAPTPLCLVPSSTGNAPLLLEIESLSLPLPLPLLLKSLSLRATPAPVVAAVTATSAGFGANTTLSGPAPARFCWVPDPAGDAPLLLEIEALSLLESAAPAPFYSAAGLASASAGDAPLPLEIEVLSLLEGATHGALRLVSDAVQTAVQAAAPNAVQAAAAEIEKLSLLGVSTHRPAPRAPARRRGRRAKRSTQSSWSWVMGAPAFDLLGVLPVARLTPFRDALWGRLGGTFDGARAAAISGVSSALMAYPSLCGLRAPNLCADIFTKALSKTLFLRHRAISSERRATSP